MASGLPDYSQIIRPKYGAANRAYDEVTVDANAETELFNISGKGMTYGGVVFLDYDSTQANGVPLVYVDDVKIADIYFAALMKRGLVLSGSYPVYLRLYDEVNHAYSVAISYGITFERSFKVAYREFDGTTPTVDFQVVYALI